MTDVQAAQMQLIWHCMTVLATEELPRGIQRLTCHYMPEQHLPQGLVLASEEPEEQGVQLCSCQLHGGQLSAGG